jgi:hypothetical protein
LIYFQYMFKIFIFKTKIKFESSLKFIFFNIFFMILIIIKKKNNFKKKYAIKEIIIRKNKIKLKNW